MFASMLRVATAAVAMLAIAQVAPTDLRPRPTAEPPASRSSPMTPPLDGFEVRQLPDGLGEPSDFAYEFDEVQFASRVWERSTPDGSVVDLTIIVMRGEVLGDVAAVHAFLAAYHEQDPATWGKEPFEANGYPGFRTADRAVTAFAPGVAVSVSVDRTRFSDDDLIATALGVTPQRTAKTAGHVTRPR